MFIKFACICILLCNVHDGSCYLDCFFYHIELLVVGVFDMIVPKSDGVMRGNVVASADFRYPSQRFKLVGENCTFVVYLN